MSLRSAMLRTANILRGIPSKPALDAWTTELTIRTRTWAGGRKDADGGYLDDDLVIVPRPRVRELTSREISGSGGRYAAGDVLVEHITPAHVDNPGVGYTQAQIAPTAPTNGVEIIYLLSGGVTGEYSRVDVKTDATVTYTLTLRRTRKTP